MKRRRKMTPSLVNRVVSRSANTDLAPKRLVDLLSGIVAIVVLVAFIFLIVLLTPDHAADVQKAPLRYGRGKVVGMLPGNVSLSGHVVSPKVSVELEGGGVYSVSSPIGFKNLNVGSAVTVSYRVARSGRIYLEAVTPW